MWRVLPGQARHERAWDEEYVVFDNLSGNTHLLDASAMEVLRAVPADAVAETELALRLQQALGLDAQEAAEIPAILDDLAELSLIESPQC